MSKRLQLKQEEIMTHTDVCHSHEGGEKIFLKQLLNKVSKCCEKKPWNKRFTTEVRLKKTFEAASLGVPEIREQSEQSVYR